MKPILFNSEAIKAILDGRKTRTRRVCKGDALEWLDVTRFSAEFVANPDNNLCPYGKVGAVLWVRETWRVNSIGYQCREHNDHNTVEIEYATLPGQARGDREWYCVTDEELIRANHYYDKHTDSFSPNIHMPKWACRTFVTPTNIRIERVQDISEADAKAEGIILVGDELVFNNRKQKQSLMRTKFQELWDSINAKRAPWKDNPYVWIVEFKRTEKP